MSSAISTGARASVWSASRCLSTCCSRSWSKPRMLSPWLLSTSIPLLKKRSAYCMVRSCAATRLCAAARFALIISIPSVKKRWVYRTLRSWATTLSATACWLARSTSIPSVKNSSASFRLCSWAVMRCSATMRFASWNEVSSVQAASATFLSSMIVLLEERQVLSHRERTLGVVSDNLHGIHARVKLFGDAIEQPEGASDQQQVSGNGADALADLHAGIHRIDIFPALARLVAA